MKSQIILFLIILMSILILCKNSNKDKLIENYSQIITRYQNATLDQNTCPKPFTNNNNSLDMSENYEFKLKVNILRILIHDIFLSFD